MERDSLFDEVRCTICFYGPDNIVFDSAFNAYITDNDHSSRFRVIKLSQYGERLGEWHIFATIPGRKNGPEGIAMAADGSVFVTDGGKLTVDKVSAAGKLLMRIGSDDSLFSDLGHVALDNSGNIYISEGARNRIHKFRSDGGEIETWKRARGEGAGAWNGPEAIAVGSSGNLIVEDWGNRRIVILSKTGHMRAIVGGRGTGVGLFENSSGLAVDSRGNIWVADETLHRVQKFDSEGKYLTVVSNSPRSLLFTKGPSSLAIDRHGRLYSADGLSIVQYSQNGRLLARWR